MSKFINPCPNAKLTSPFGYRIHPISKVKSFHQGIDLAQVGDVPIMASANGTVLQARWMNSYGNVIIIRHIINGATFDTVYAHLKSFNVKKDDKVKQGQVIAKMGTTGDSTGQHLHFEINTPYWTTGQPYAKNPLNYISLTSNPTPQSSTDKKIGYKIDEDSKAFRIHTDSFKSKLDAQKAQKDFVSKGYLKYAEAFGNDKDGYRLQSGKYTTQKDAESVSKKMLEAKVVGYCSIIGSKS